MCWREHSRPQEAGPAAQEHSTLCPPPGEQTSVDRGWICSLDSGEHSWGSWESGKDGGAGKGLNQRDTAASEKHPVHTEKKRPQTPGGVQGRPAPLPPSPVSAPWRRAYQPTPVSLPGESHGQRSLAGYSPWGCKGQKQLSD